MDILEIINEMEEVIEESTRVPLVGKVLLDDDLIIEYLDRIRSAIPEEIRQAKLTYKEKNRILNEAHEEAKKVLDNAQMEINRLASESEVTKQAQKQAEEIYVKAKNTAREIRQGANNYADETLKKLEENLQRAIGIVKNGRNELKPKGAKEQVAAGKDN